MEVQLRRGTTAEGIASFFRWQHADPDSAKASGDIVRYRVIEEAAKGVKDTNPKDAAATGRVPMHMVPDTLVLYAAIAFAEGDSKYIAYNFRVAGVRASVYISPCVAT